MKFNFKPSLPDLRDHIYRSDSAEVLREIVDFREKDTIVESQETLGSCSSNALTNAYEISVNFQYPDKLKQLSRLFIYYNTREMNGNVLEDNGIFLRDGLKSLSKYGVCTEELWPYEIDKFDDKPSEQCYEDAKQRKIVGYQKLMSIHYITQVLNNNNPVVFGMRIYESFMDLNEHISIVTIPSRKEKVIGDHAMCMVGYDLQKRLFLVKNSFGVNWGVGGYCWVSFDYIKQEGYDIWTFQIPDQSGD